MDEHLSMPCSRAGEPRRGLPIRAARNALGPHLRVVLAVVLGSFALLALAPVAGAQAAGAIQGTVTEAGSKPVDEVEVTVFAAASHEFVRATTTNIAGEYELASLPAGSYKVQFSPAPGSQLVGQFYNAKTTFALADTLTVASVPLTGIDAELAKGATISGVVKAEGVALEGAEVVALPVGAEQSFFGLATTKAGGAYTIVGVPPGEYTVYFSPQPGENLVAQLWDESESFSGATHVVVSGEAEASNINANLRIGGQISGTVTDAVTHQPLANVFVLATNSRGDEFLGGDAETDANGNYTIPGLATGSYTLEFVAEGPATEYLALKTGLVGVTQPATTPGLNVALTRAAPVDTSPPAISGTPVVGGGALACSTGTWTGKAVLKYTYQWTRDGAPIANATASSYVVQAADQGHGLVCQVTATNAVGHATAASGTLAVPPPSVVQLPSEVFAPVVPVARSLVSKVIVSGSTARVPVSCKAARCAGTLELLQQVVTRTHRGHRTIVRRKTITLAGGAYSLAGGRNGLVTLRLTAAGRRRLALARGHRLAAMLVLTVKGGKTTRQPVIVKRAAAKRRR